MDEDKEPRRFTRGRLSRGRGLRKTTGCVACRRRHVKCDEARPRCGGCMRKKIDCVYAARRPIRRRVARSEQHEQEVDDGSEDSDRPNEERREDWDGTDSLAIEPSLLPAADEEPRRSETVDETHNEDATLVQNQAIDDAVNGDSNVLQDDSIKAPTVGFDSTSQHFADDSELSTTHLDAQTLFNFSHSHPLLQEPAEPVQVSPQAPVPAFVYHDTPDSGPSQSGDLALRWPDLLIADATVNYGPLPELPLHADGLDIFGNSVAQTPVASDEAGTPAAKDNSAQDSVATVQNVYLLERVVDKRGIISRDKKLWQAAEPIPLQPQEHVLFRHFTEHISRWMDLFEPQRPFGTLVPHLALHNIGLMNAILALSARHLRNINRSNPSCPEYRPDSNDTLSYYWKTLHYSQKAMEYDTYQTSLELLASAIIISSYEMLDGSNTDWEKHLKGVFWIQRSQVIHGDSGGLRQAVWWAWLSQDVWAAFREKRKPFTFWQPTRTLPELTPHQLAARSVYNFAHIVGFCAETGIPEDVARKTHEAELLLKQLQHWKSHLTVEYEPLPIHNGTEVKMFPTVWIQPSAFGVAMQLYYCSLILLHIHRPCYGGFKEHLEKQKMLKKWASTVCGIAMSSTDDASTVMSSQCVYIAGMIIEAEDQRAAILEYLDTSSQLAGWPGYSLGRELNDIWGND